MNFDKKIFQKLQINSLEVACANFEGSTTIFIFYPIYPFVHNYVYRGAQN